MKLVRFLNAVLPDHVSLGSNDSALQSRDELIKDILDGVTAATMAIRIT